MTQQPETRFICDRCKTEISVPMNDQPAKDHGKAPGDWVVLHINSVTVPAHHLCPECGPLFFAYLEKALEP
jgi:hypothetical protein